MTRRAGVALALALAAGAPTAAAEPPAAAPPAGLAAHLERLAPTVVTLKFVLRVRAQGRESESNAEVRGTVVDASGIVMTSSAHFEAGGGMIRQLRRQGMHVDVQATPSDFKVIVGNDPKEHDAALLAQDSRLGLAFVQMLSTEGVTLQPANLASAATVAVGDTLFGVSRLGRGFDYAPVVDTLLVTGKVEKPRAMWDVSGGFRATGVPVYAAGGAVGVLSVQEGADGGGGGGGGFPGFGLSGDGSRVFLIPAGPVAASVEAAKKRAPEVLARAKEAAKAAEDAAAAEAAKPAEAPAAPAPGTPPAPNPDAPKPDAPK